jgi:hypothetical protein
MNRLQSVIKKDVLDEMIQEGPMRGSCHVTPFALVFGIFPSERGTPLLDN